MERHCHKQKARRVNWHVHDIFFIARCSTTLILSCLFFLPDCEIWRVACIPVQSWSFFLPQLLAKFIFKACDRIFFLAKTTRRVWNRTCNLMKSHGPPIPYVPCFARGFFVIQSYAVNLVVQFQYVLHFHLVFSVFLYIQWFKIWPIWKGLMSETTAPGTFPG